VQLFSASILTLEALESWSVASLTQPCHLSTHSSYVDTTAVLTNFFKCVEWDTLVPYSNLIIQPTGGIKYTKRCVQAQATMMLVVVVDAIEAIDSKVPRADRRSLKLMFFNGIAY
jgi:hypothetical protein